MTTPAYHEVHWVVDWVRAHAAWVRAEDELERCLAALGEGGRA